MKEINKNDMVDSFNQEIREKPGYHLVWRLSLGILAVVFLIAVFLLLLPKPLAVKGTLKSAEGPIAAGVYDFRLKFYDITTRTDVVYSHDARGVQVDENGSFDVKLTGAALTKATLMQVCISSPGASLEKGKMTIPSCEDPEKTDDIGFNQTVCGLTTVDQDPTNPISWLSSKSTIYTMPTRACGGTDGEVASVSGRDVVTPLLESPGTLGEVLSGVEFQPGTVLSIGDTGQLEAISPKTLGEEVAAAQEATEESEEVVAPPVTTTPPSSSAIVQGEANTDQQTLAIAGNVLSISGGNSVTLPSNGSSDGDAVIGNEITDVVGSGLVRVGAGTALDPYKVHLQTCADGEILESNSGSWGCTPNTGGSSYLAGSGLNLAGTTFSVDSPTCAGTTKLQWNGSAFVCSTDVDTTYGAGTGLSLAGTTFNNTGVLGVSGSGPIASSGGQNPTINFMNGTTPGQVWQWNGSAWALATLSADGDGVIGNEVTNVTGSNSGLVRSGSGTSGDPYTLAANTGSGLQIVANQLAINSPTCAGTDKLQWSGSAFVCATDQNTTYSAITNGGLRLVGTQFGLVACTDGQLLKATATSGEYVCAADNNTTYSAGSGLSLAGTTFSNTGVLSVAGSGPITSTGGQNPTVSFADGANTGEFWQWNGSAWVLASLPANGDGVVGNEVTNITGSNSGLARSGSGTAVDPYTLAVSVGNGIQLTGGNVAINSPTCSGTDKLQWSGSAFVCSSDVNTTYSAGTGLSLVGTTFNNTGVLSVTASGALTSSAGQNPNIAFANGSITGQFWQWDGDSWELAALPVNGDGVIGNEVTNVTGSNSGLVRSGSGTAVDPYTLAVSVGNGLQLTSGNVAVNSPTCSGTTKLQWNGTAFVCSADVDTDTTNFSITDSTTTQSVAATQAITFSGDANDKTTVTLGGTRQLTFGLDTTGALSGQVLAYNGTNLAWQSPTTYAPTNCNATSTYICQSGNTLGGAITVGTNDAFALNFETGGNTAMTVLTNGKVGVGDAAPAQTLTVNGQIGMPSTSATTGILFINNVRALHTYGGISNIFVGQNSGNVTQTGTFNAGFGGQALLNVTSGSFNTAVSTNGLLNTTTGSLNTAVGTQALLLNTTGSDNTAVGHNAGHTGTSGAFANTTGNFNTFIGSLSGPGSATQLTNATAIGAYATVAQSNSVILGCVSGVVSCPQTQTIGIGNPAPTFLLHVGSATSMPSGATVTRFENGGGTCSVIPSTAGGITCTSDERSKKNIVDYNGALAIVNQIEVREYNMKTDPNDATKQIGVIAQQVEGLLPSLVTTDSDGKKAFSYAGLTPVLLQAIKEQQAQIADIQKGVWSGGVVTKDATFKATATFEGPVKFSQNATFEGDATILGKIKLSSDQVNSVYVPAGRRSVQVSFKGTYENLPYITATPRDFIRGEYRVTDVTSTGFTIEVSQPQSKDIRFDWHAFSR